MLWAAPLPPPWLQYIKDHCLAATTASASSIRPQITPSESKLSDLPFCEISSSSDFPRASTRHQNSRRHWHAPSRVANTSHALSRASRIRHEPTRACTCQDSLLTLALGDVICHVIRYVICWRHLPRHLLTSVDFDHWPALTLIEGWLWSLTFCQSWLLQSRCSLPSFSRRFHFCSLFLHFLLLNEE